MVSSIDRTQNTDASSDWKHLSANKNSSSPFSKRLIGKVPQQRSGAFYLGKFNGLDVFETVNTDIDILSALGKQHVDILEKPIRSMSNRFDRLTSTDKTYYFRTLNAQRAMNTCLKQWFHSPSILGINPSEKWIEMGMTLSRNFMDASYDLSHKPEIESVFALRKPPSTEKAKGFKQWSREVFKYLGTRTENEHVDYKLSNIHFQPDIKLNNHLVKIWGEGESTVILPGGGLTRTLNLDHFQKGKSTLKLQPKNVSLADYLE